MVFSTQTILESRKRDFNSIEKKPVLENTVSYFFDTLEMITNENMELEASINNFSNSLYLETGDITKTILSNINFKSIISTLFEKFLQIIKDNFNKFKAWLSSFVSQDKIIKHYKKELENFQYEFNYREERYIYTNLGLTRSYTSLKNNLSGEIGTLIMRLNDFRNFNSYDKVYNALEEMKNESEESEYYLSQIRGEIVGSITSLDKNQYAEELFNYFRNDGSIISTSTIGANEVREICKDYFNHQKIMKTIEIDKNEMISAIGDIKKTLNKINLDDFVKNEYASKANSLFAEIIKNKITRTKEICNIYLLFYTAKIDAEKEAYEQYRDILAEACKVLIKGGVN